MTTASGGAGGSSGGGGGGRIAFVLSQKEDLISAIGAGMVRAWGGSGSSTPLVGSPGTLSWRSPGPSSPATVVVTGHAAASGSTLLTSTQFVAVDVVNITGAYTVEAHAHGFAAQRVIGQPGAVLQVPEGGFFWEFTQLEGVTLQLGTGVPRVAVGSIGPLVGTYTGGWSIHGTTTGRPVSHCQMGGTVGGDGTTAPGSLAPGGPAFAAISPVAPAFNVTQLADGSYSFTCLMPRMPPGNLFPIRLSIGGSSSSTPLQPLYSKLVALARYSTTCDALAPLDMAASTAACNLSRVGNAVCDAGCDQPACAYDNHDCISQAGGALHAASLLAAAAPVAPGGLDAEPVPPAVHAHGTVYVAPQPAGNDASGTGTRGAPFATLGHAVAFACKGFDECLPVTLMPGRYRGVEHIFRVRHSKRFTLQGERSSFGSQPSVLQVDEALLQEAVPWIQLANVNASIMNLAIDVLGDTPSAVDDGTVLPLPRILIAAEWSRVSMHNVVMRAHDTASSNTVANQAMVRLTNSHAALVDCLFDGVVLDVLASPMATEQAQPPNSPLALLCQFCHLYISWCPRCPDLDTHGMPRTHFHVATDLVRTNFTNPAAIRRLSERPATALRAGGISHGMVVSFTATHCSWESLASAPSGAALQVSVRSVPHNVVPDSADPARSAADAHTVSQTGAAVDVLITNSRFRGSTSSANGGAVAVNVENHLWDAVSVELQDCELVGNTASQGGGAVAVELDAMSSSLGAPLPGDTISPRPVVVGLGVMLTRCRLTQNTAADKGGAVMVFSSSAVEPVLPVENGAPSIGPQRVSLPLPSGLGGETTSKALLLAPLLTGSVVTLDGCSLASNVAGAGGGGVFVQGMSQNMPLLRVRGGCDMRENVVLSGGGASVMAASAAVVDTGGTRYATGAGADGGGHVQLLEGSLATFDGPTIEDGEGTFGGGLLLTDQSAALVSHAVISDCDAYTGGGVHVRQQSVLALVNSTITRCTAKAAGGGAMASTGSTLAIVRSTVSACSAGLEGSALVIMPTVQVAMNETVMTGNSITAESTAQAGSRKGGAVLVNQGAKLSMEGCTISGNAAARWGAGASAGGLVCRATSSITTAGELTEVSMNTPFNFECSGCSINGATCSNVVPLVEGGLYEGHATSVQHPPLPRRVDIAGAHLQAGVWPWVPHANTSVVVAVSQTGAQAPHVTHALLHSSSSASFVAPPGVGTAVPVFVYIEGRATPAYSAPGALWASTTTQSTLLLSYSKPRVHDASPNPLPARGGTIAVLGQHFGDPGVSTPVVGVVRVAGGDAGDDASVLDTSTDVPCDALEHVSDVELRCVLPALLSGFVRLRVTVGGVFSLSRVLAQTSDLSVQWVDSTVSRLPAWLLPNKPAPSPEALAPIIPAPRVGVYNATRHLQTGSDAGGGGGDSDATAVCTASVVAAQDGSTVGQTVGVAKVPLLRGTAVFDRFGIAAPLGSAVNVSVLCTTASGETAATLVEEVSIPALSLAWSGVSVTLPELELDGAVWAKVELSIVSEGATAERGAAIGAAFDGLATRNLQVRVQY